MKLIRNLEFEKNEKQNFNIFDINLKLDKLQKKSHKMKNLEVFNHNPKTIETKSTLASFSTTMISK